jgi:hypothetical protein
MAKKLIFGMLVFCLALPGPSRAANIKLGFINSITGPEENGN